MPTNYFNAKRDSEIIEAGGFFCHTCLVSKPATEQSLDGRYCKGCYLLLVADSDSDTTRDRELQGVGGVTEIVLLRIKEMSAQGMSCRGIEKELAKEGVTISYRTILRRLKEMPV